MESKEDKLSVPDLPETFEGRYNQLRSLVNEAVLSLLEEVKKRDALSKKHPDKPAYLTAPYGRLPPPTPLMTYDEFLALKEKGIPEFDMKIEDIPDPSFEFKYGFNPLTYISDYLKWWHPTSAEQRKQIRNDSMMALHKTALLAKQKCGQQAEQAMRVAVASSGIVYGPLISPISETSVKIVALALQTKGHITFQLSRSTDFVCMDRVVECEVHDEGAASCIIEDLTPASQYYLRASFSSDGVLAKQKAEALRLQKEAEGMASGSSKKKSKKSKNVDEESQLPTEENTDATDPTNTAEEKVDADVVNLPDKIDYILYRDNFGEVAMLPRVFTGIEGGLFQTTAFTTLPSMDSIEETFTPSQSRPGTAPSTPGVSRVGTPVAGVMAEGFGGDLNILRNSVTLVAESRQPRSKQPEWPSETMCFAGTGEVPADIVSVVDNKKSSDSSNSFDTNSDKEILINCVLGDVFEETKTDAIKFFSSGCSSTLTSSSILHKASTIYAWNDTTSGSFMDLMAEELVYKEYQYALKKYKKKYESNDPKAKEKRKKEKDNHKDKTPPPPPTLNRPEPSAKFTAFTHLFPVLSTEHGATRHTYRMLNVGRFVDLFVLDMREGMLGKAQSKWLIEMLEGSSAAWKIVLAGKPLGLVEKTKDVTATAEKRSGTISPVVALEKDTNVTGTEERLAATNNTIKAQEETMAAVSSSSLPFVFSSVMQTYMSSPDASPMNSRPTSRQQNNETLSTTALNNEVEDAGGKENENSVADEPNASSAVGTSVDESLVIDVGKEIAENAATDLIANSQTGGKTVDFAPLPINENSSSSSVKSISVSSGIIFLTGGTPFPFLASYGSESKGHHKGECFAVEVGTGNSVWPASVKSNQDNFEADSSLNPKFMFGGFNENEGNVEDQIITSSRVTLKINTASEDGISLKVLNTADVRNEESVENGYKIAEDGSATMVQEGYEMENEASIGEQNDGSSSIEAKVNEYNDVEVKTSKTATNDISDAQVMYEINFRLI